MEKALKISNGQKTAVNESGINEMTLDEQLDFHMDEWKRLSKLKNRN